MTKRPNAKPDTETPSSENKDARKTFSVIVPHELEARLSASAKDNKRNRNAEVIARLESSYSQPLFQNNFGDTDIFAFCQIIGRMIHYAQLDSGSLVFDDEEAHSALKKDISDVLDAFGPDGGIPAPGQGVSPRVRGHLDKLYQMKKHGRGDDESADAHATEQILDDLGDNFRDKLEPKLETIH